MDDFDQITRQIGRDHCPQTHAEWFAAFSERIEAMVGESMPNPARLCADVVAEHLGLPRQ